MVRGHERIDSPPDEDDGNNDREYALRVHVAGQEGERRDSQARRDAGIRLHDRAGIKNFRCEARS